MIVKQLLLILIINILSSNQIPSKNLYERKCSSKLTFKEWESYKRGIKVMKERSKNDPTGFLYQSNLHAWPEYNGTFQATMLAKQMNWHQGQHAQYFFLVWHRMYLYFYERILRKAANDPYLTLPYWDYSGSKANRALPEAFRLPADEAKNVLYLEKGRRLAINRGVPLKLEESTSLDALKNLIFTIDSNADALSVCYCFAGGRVDKPILLGKAPGLLQMLPYFAVNREVGGPDGLLSDICKSAMDPIFILQHAQIDRIFETWTNLSGGVIPTNDYKFLKQKFDFFNENGARLTVEVKDFLNITKLGYKYDNLISGKEIKPVNKLPPLNIVVRVENIEDIESGNELSITSEETSIVTDLEEKTINLFEDMAQNKSHLAEARFSLQFDVEFMQTSLIYDIYFNLDPESMARNQQPYFIGSIMSFSPKCIQLQDIDSKDKIPKSITDNINFCFDVTKQLRDILTIQYNSFGFVKNQLNLTFVGRDCSDNYAINSTDIIELNSFTLLYICDH